MLDGLWQVYTEDGEYIGFCDSTVGGNTIFLSKKAERRIKKLGIKAGDTLHIDEQYSSRALAVKVVRFYDFRDREPAFEYEVTEERKSKYKKRKVKFGVRSSTFA